MGFVMMPRLLDRVRAELGETDIWTEAMNKDQFRSSKGIVTVLSQQRMRTSCL